MVVDVHRNLLNETLIVTLTYLMGRYIVNGSRMTMAFIHEVVRSLHHFEAFSD